MVSTISIALSFNEKHLHIKFFLALSILLCADGVSASPDSTLRSSPVQSPKTQHLQTTNSSSVQSPQSTKQAKKKEPEKTLSEAEKKAAYSALKALHLRSPIDGFDLNRIKGAYYEKRGQDQHNAADFVVERNTPVHAVTKGKIAKLFLSKAGGITIYLFDPSERFVFYYAHLEKYADGLEEGKTVQRGEIIGYVGTSGNAPPDSPHLHFSIGVLDQSKKWWDAVEVDPYEVLSDK
ncbi:MAG: M23 family metallopeptidase [Candidatus Obscuribacterales bacterium]|nr:M23 family metallopeptidase [Candidatus Obscuribacterales bacterium]